MTEMRQQRTGLLRQTVNVPLNQNYTLKEAKWL